MKSPRAIPLVLPLLAAAALAYPAHAGSVTTTFTNTLEGLGTRETATRQVDGLTITYPADEADVVERLLPDIRAYRAKRQADAKVEAEAIVERFSSEEFRSKYRTLITALPGLESLDAKAFDTRYDSALEQVKEFIGRWRRWSGDLGGLRFWNKATVREFDKEGSFGIPDIRFLSAANDKITYTLQFPFPVNELGADFITSRSDGGQSAFRLDIPLRYPPGISAAEVAEDPQKVLASIPALMHGAASKLDGTTQASMAELLLRSTIGEEFFTKEAARQNEALIHGLARYYFVLCLQATGQMTSGNEKEIMHKLVTFDLPKQESAISLLEALDPFSISGEATPTPEILRKAENRLAFATLLNLTKKSDNDGTPLLQKLQKMSRVPKGGFASGADFAAAVEAAYPGRLREEFLSQRAGLVADARVRLAAPSETVATSSAEAPAEEPPLPGRETLNFDGVTISFPISLQTAVQKWGPQAANARKQATAAVAVQSSGDTPQLPIVDGTLDFLRTQGIEVTRADADAFAATASTLTQTRETVLRSLLGSWKAIQIWVIDDLKDLLAKGHHVPGFTYDAATNKASFKFNETVTLPDPSKKAEDIAPIPSRPPLPIVLTDRKILELPDTEAQVALLQEQGQDIFSALEARANAVATKSESSRESPRKKRDAEEAFFISVHELVEADLIRNVIASKDRRWFYDGMANLLAIRAWDHQLGKAARKSGRKLFESLYDPDRLGKLAPEVRLLAWPPLRQGAEESPTSDSLTAAHYYFATLVMLEATKGRGDDFIAAWIAAIRETPWNRTNAGTVIAAYDKLTGESLRRIIESTVP